MKRLIGKRALVTGASSGLGAHFAAVFARHGITHLALGARRIEKLSSLAAELEEKYSNTGSLVVLPVEIDVTNPQSVEEGLVSIEESFGAPCDVIVNNAGISLPKRMLELPLEDYDTVMNTNLRGSWLVTQKAASRLVAVGSPGSIINIAR